MKIYKRLIICFLSFSNLIFAQNLPQNIEDLAFNSPLETVSFQMPLISETERLHLFATVNPAITETDIKLYESMLVTFYKRLEKKGIHKKNTIKELTLIHEQAHQYFFKTYENYASLEQTFKEGVYNCLTATAILALTLDHFNIQYQIQEERNHIYLLVEDEGKSIVVEGTNPKNGVYEMNKAALIAEWTELDIISERELEEKSVEQLYEEYSKKQELKISYREIAGNLYFNEAIVYYEAGQFKEANEMMDKGHFLHPNRTAIFSQMAIISNLEIAIDVQRPSSLKPLLDFLKHDDYRAAAVQDILGLLNFAATKFLTNENKPEQYFQLFNYLKSQIKGTDEAALLAIEKVHYANMAFAMATKDDFEKMLFYLDSAYHLDRSAIRTQAMIADAIIQKAAKTSLADLDNLLTGFQKKYSFLADFNDYGQALVYGKAGVVADFFKKEDAENGFVAFAVFEKKYKEKPLNEEMNRAVISAAYGAVHSFYVRKGDYQTAKIWLEKGLVLAPNSSDLVRKKITLNEFLK